jgi:methionyl-tRNA formyltransferase
VKQPSAVIQRLVYLGTPALAVPPLQALHTAGFEIPLVVTNPDKRRGRGGATAPSPVKLAALELGLAVTDSVDDVLAVDANIGVVVAFGRLIKPPILDGLAMVNIHFSLLPRWRGAAPVERAILAGDSETGICLMALEETLDTGPVYRRIAEPVRPDDTVESLRARLVALSGPLLVDAFAEGLGIPVPQAGEPVYAHKIDPAELQIDWTADAETVGRLVRLGAAWTTFRGRRLRIWEAAVGDAPRLEPGTVGAGTIGTGSAPLQPLVVQPEGKGRMEATAWLNGARIGTDERLGS